MDPLAFLADRLYGRPRRYDETTREATQRGLHRLGFRRGYVACLVMGVTFYALQLAVTSLLGAS